MTERNRTTPGGDEQKARDAVRRLSLVAPDPHFEQRLHDRFVTGSLAPVSRPVRWLQVPRWIFIPAAAALFAVAFFLNRGPSWDIRSMNDRGSIVVEGYTVALGDEPEMEQRLGRGGPANLDHEARFELSLPGLIVIEATPATQVEVPKPPGRWFGRTLAAHVETGEVRFLTGPRFSGHRLLVTTPEGRVEVTGTIVSVFRDESGTCVCVMNGAARVGTGDDDMETVLSGQRKVIPKADKAPYITDIQTEHSRGMIEFESRHPDMRK